MINGCSAGQRERRTNFCRNLVGSELSLELLVLRLHRSDDLVLRQSKHLQLRLVLRCELLKLQDNHTENQNFPKILL